MKNSSMTINGMAVPEIDVTDADVIQRYLDCLKRIDDIPAYTAEQDYITYIRNRCSVVRQGFDALFGDGIGALVLTKDSIKVAETVISDLIAYFSYRTLAGSEQITSNRARVLQQIENDANRAQWHKNELHGKKRNHGRRRQNNSQS